MSSEEKEDNGFKISLDKLSSKEAIPIWLLRCKVALRQRAANRNTKTNLPNPTNYSLQLLTNSINDEYLEEILHLDPFDAPTIWQYFQSIQNANDLTAKTLSLQECINFDYPAATMVQNRTLLQVLTRKVTAAFGGEPITSRISSLYLLMLIFPLLSTRYAPPYVNQNPVWNLTVFSNLLFVRKISKK